MNSPKKLLTIILITCFVLFLFVGFDVFPLLRGPGDWRLPYLYINTVSRAFPSLILILIVVYIFSRIDRFRDNEIGKREKFFLPLLVILGFLFQISILYFSRAGISVLLSRIIQPEANGYFTASLDIKNLSDFLKDYNSLLSTFSIHSSQHPPGATIMFYALGNFFNLFPFFNNFVDKLSISTKPIVEIWLSLLPNQKTAAIASSLLIPLFSSLVLIPLYYLFKVYRDTRIALRGVFLYLFIPSLVLFIPLPDVYFPLFSIMSFLFLTLALRKKKRFYLFLSGVILSLGIFFSLSFLSFILMFLIYIFLQNIKNIRVAIVNSFAFLIWIALFYFLAYLFFGYNFIDVFYTIHRKLMNTIDHRSYFVWIFFNFIEFLLFAGIPIFTSLIYAIKKNYLILKNNALFLSLIITLLFLNFSGRVRGESSRLFIPFLPFLILLVATFLTKEYHFKTKHFLIIYLLQAIQILIMQEFWVILW